MYLDANKEMTKGGNPKKGSISQLTKDNAMICAHEYLGGTGGISKTSGKRIDYILVTAGIITSNIWGRKRTFEEGVTSDHKALLLDLDAEILFGKRTGNIDIQLVRKSITKYPKKTDKYIEDVLNKFEKMGVFSALGDLKKRAYMTKTWTPKMERKFNNIDTCATEILISCEKTCIPSAYGEFPGVQS